MSGTGTRSGSAAGLCPSRPSWETCPRPGDPAGYKQYSSLTHDPWLPVIRSPGQRYIFWELESPAYLLGFPPQAYANYFNWTATFRLDSTVPLPYGRVTKVTQDG